MKEDESPRDDDPTPWEDRKDHRASEELAPSGSGAAADELAEPDTGELSFLDLAAFDGSGDKAKELPSGVSHTSQDDLSSKTTSDSAEASRFGKLGGSRPGAAGPETDDNRPRPASTASRPGSVSGRSGEPVAHLLDDTPEAEPFHQPGAAKLGIVGGKQTGKSYLFQAMVYRTLSARSSGALALFLHSTSLYSALRRTDQADKLNVRKFSESYREWRRLLPNLIDTQMWYRLRLRFHSGLLGSDRSILDIQFFDGSGEQLFEATTLTREKQRFWRDGYLDARVMVFCLPMWAVFPDSELGHRDLDEIDGYLSGFAEMLSHFRELRERYDRRHPVRCILALTMADDVRCRLDELQQRWISPYMREPDRYLTALRTGKGVARYLMNARTVSQLLQNELQAAEDPYIRSVPERLDFGLGRPFVVAVSAIDGSVVDTAQMEEAQSRHNLSRRHGLPVPVHVELPLLVALTDQTNALM